MAILKEKISKALGDRLSTMSLKITNLEYGSISTLIINDEKSRRMADMLEIYGFINKADFSAKEMQAKSTLLVNLNNEIIRFILESPNEMVINIVINQLFDLALMSQQALKPEDVEKFMGRLNEKIAIITGGNSGIGRATAELFCKEGAKVVIASRREDKNQQIVDEITAQGGEIMAVQADVSKMEDCKRIVDETIKKYGHVDILVNNAGIGDRHIPINLCTEEWYEKVCMINQFSIFI